MPGDIPVDFTHLECLWNERGKSWSHGFRTHNQANFVILLIAKLANPHIMQFVRIDCAPLVADGDMPAVARIDFIHGRLEMRTMGGVILNAAKHKHVVNHLMNDHILPFALRQII